MNCRWHNAAGAILATQRREAAGAKIIVSIGPAIDTIGLTPGRNQHRCADWIESEMQLALSPSLQVNRFPAVGDHPARHAPSAALPRKNVKVPARAGLRDAESRIDQAVSLVFALGAVAPAVFTVALVAATFASVSSGPLAALVHALVAELAAARWPTLPRQRRHPNRQARTSGGFSNAAARLLLASVIWPSTTLGDFFLGLGSDLRRCGCKQRPSRSSAESAGSAGWTVPGHP